MIFLYCLQGVSLHRGTAYGGFRRAVPFFARSVQDVSDFCEIQNTALPDANCAVRAVFIFVWFSV